MSLRETTLCDKKLGGGTLCSKQAVGKCPLCEDDVCIAHSLHPKGGMVLTLAFVSVNMSTNPPLDYDRHKAVERHFVCQECVPNSTEVEAVAGHVVSNVAEGLRSLLASRGLK